MSATEIAPNYSASELVVPDLQVFNIQDLQDEVGLTNSRYEAPKKIKKLASLVVGRIASRAAEQDKDAPPVITSVIANADPTLTTLTTGLAGALGPVQVKDPRSGNTLNIGEFGHIAQVDNNAGQIEVSLGESSTTGSVTVTDLEISITGQVADEARVPVSLMNAKSFIPNPEGMPDINTDGLDRPLGKYEVIRVKYEDSALASLVAVVKLFRTGEAPVEVEPGSAWLSRIITVGNNQNDRILSVGELAY